jgi:protein SCO1/2
MKSLARAMLALAVALPLCAAAAQGLDAGRRDISSTADFVQRLDQSLPADARFQDERGTAVRLGDYLGAGPLGMVFAYYSCSTLCPSQIRNLAQRLAQAPGAAADQAQILVVSIDPTDTPTAASQAKHKFLDNLLPPERAAHWHFLSGAPADVSRLAQAAGFRYGYDEATHQYAHPAGIALVTAEGKIARYFFGFDFTAGELGQAFDQVATRRIASPIERLLQVCFHYDLTSATYGSLIFEVLRAASIVTVLGLVALTSMLFRRARRRRTAGP